MPGGEKDLAEPQKCCKSTGAARLLCKAVPGQPGLGQDGQGIQGTMPRLRHHWQQEEAATLSVLAVCGGDSPGTDAFDGWGL